MEVESGHVEAMLPLASCIIMQPRDYASAYPAPIPWPSQAGRLMACRCPLSLLGALFWVFSAQPMTTRRGIDTPAAFHRRHWLLTVRAGSGINLGRVFGEPALCLLHEPLRRLGLLLNLLLSRVYDVRTEVTHLIGADAGMMIHKRAIMALDTRRCRQCQAYSGCP